MLGKSELMRIEMYRISNFFLSHGKLLISLSLISIDEYSHVYCNGCFAIHHYSIVFAGTERSHSLTLSVKFINLFLDDKFRYNPILIAE